LKKEDGRRSEDVGRGVGRTRICEQVEATVILLIQTIDREDGSGMISDGRQELVVSELGVQV